MQLAQGGEFWGRAVPARTVLYLCLEDTYARIQNRLFRLTEDTAPDRLYFQTACEAIGQGLERQIETFLTRHPVSYTHLDVYKRQIVDIIEIFHPSGKLKTLQNGVKFFRHSAFQ